MNLQLRGVGELLIYLQLEQFRLLFFGGSALCWGVLSGRLLSGSSSLGLLWVVGLGLFRCLLGNSSLNGLLLLRHLLNAGSSRSGLFRTLFLGLYRCHLFGLCRGLHLFSLLLRGLLLRGLLAYGVEVDLPQRLELLLVRRLQKTFGTCCLRLLGGLLLFRFLLEELVGLRAHLLVLLEGFHECFILSIVEFKGEFRLHLTQFLFLLQELHCRLESDVQFSNCFI